MKRKSFPVMVLAIGFILAIVGFILFFRSDRSFSDTSQIIGKVIDIDEGNIQLQLGKLVKVKEETFMGSSSTTTIAIEDEKLVYIQNHEEVKSASLKDIKSGQILAIELGDNSDIKRVIVMEDLD